MKIDFHTHYKEEDFRGLCERAIELELDALVMEGVPFEEDYQYTSSNGELRVFPAKEVEWKAALEIPCYKKRMDAFLDKEPTSIKTRVYGGKSFVILPLGTSYEQKYDSRLFNLLEQISRLEGLNICLSEEDSGPIVRNFEAGKKDTYEFDATRVRPYTDDVLLGGSDKYLVAGSSASSPSELGSRSAFTTYDKDITSRDQLIEAVKNRKPKNLQVFTEEGIIDFEDTKKKYRFKFRNFLRDF